MKTAKTPPRNINSAPYWHIDPTKPVTYHMTVRILPREIIERLAVLSRLERFGDEAGTHLATEREAVAFIRHCLINRRPNTPPPNTLFRKGSPCLTPTCAIAMASLIL